MFGGVAGELALAHQMPVETAQRRDPARDARRPEAAGSQALEVADDVVGSGTVERAMVVVEELGEVGEVAAVGTESISGGPPLCLEGAEILDDRIGHRVTQADSITRLDDREGRAALRVASQIASRQRVLSRSGRRTRPRSAARSEMPSAALAAQNAAAPAAIVPASHATSAAS